MYSLAYRTPPGSSLAIQLQVGFQVKTLYVLALMTTGW